MVNVRSFNVMLCCYNCLNNNILTIITRWYFAEHLSIPGDANAYKMKECSTMCRVLWPGSWSCLIIAHDENTDILLVHKPGWKQAAKTTEKMS